MFWLNLKSGVYDNTSSVSVAQKREFPDIAKADREAAAGEQEIDFARERVSFGSGFVVRRLRRLFNVELL